MPAQLAHLPPANLLFLAIVVFAFSSFAIGLFYMWARLGLDARAPSNRVAVVQAAVRPTDPVGGSLAH